MNKFEEQYRIIMESMGSQAMIDQGVYDLFLNLVLDKIQDKIREVFGSLGNLEIEYEKTYVCLHWSNIIEDTEVKYKFLIDQDGTIVLNVFNINEEIIFENTLHFDSLDIIDTDIKDTLIAALSFADEYVDGVDTDEQI